uniref:Uncharacterized protein n=1 Tax=Arundo donax TaxID=35708 RepID=A0A0A8XSP6_ARUDO
MRGIPSLGGVIGYLVDLVDPPNVVVEGHLSVAAAAAEAPEVLLHEGEPAEKLLLLHAPRPPRPVADAAVEVPLHGLGARLRLPGAAHVRHEGRRLRPGGRSGCGGISGGRGSCRAASCRGSRFLARLGLPRLLGLALGFGVGVRGGGVVRLRDLGLLRPGSLHGGRCGGGALLHGAAMLCSGSA